MGKMLNKEIAKVFIQPGRYGFGSKGNEELGVPPDAALTYVIEIKNLVKVNIKYMNN